jgi:hypothetical protein
VNVFVPAHIKKSHFKGVFFFTIKDRSAIYLVKKLKIMKNVPVQPIFTGKK